jgi:two-component system, OmpR family, response regulator
MPNDKQRKGASPINVLVIEDHPDTLEAMTRLLRISFRVVRAAESCAVARDLAASADGPPHVVVGDIGLPDGDGIDLLTELKARYGCAAIALSGFDDVARCIESGIDRHLLKPVELQKLREAIEALGTPRLD